MKPRLHFILPNIGPGGAQKIIITLCNTLSKNYDCSLILLNGRKRFYDVSDEVHIIDLKATNFFQAVIAIRRIMKKEKPGVLLSTTELVNVLICLLKPLFSNKIKCVGRISNTLSEIYKNDRSPVTFFIRWVAPLVYRSFSDIICVSHGVADDLVSLNPRVSKKIKVIYNPIIDEKLHILKIEKPNHRWLGKHKIILAVGRLWKQKNYEGLLLAFKMVAVQRKDVRLIILGDGPEEKTLKHYADGLNIREKVDFAGYQHNPFSYMHHSDVYVMSSLYEGLPGALIQALACEANIVSTDCKSGPAEILDHGKYGRLVPVRDVKALAKALSDALEEPLVPPDDLHLWLQQFESSSTVAAYEKVLIN
jgi:glycosyltransferase involved in cell wall biosynthesis